MTSRKVEVVCAEWTGSATPSAETPARGWGPKKEALLARVGHLGTTFALLVLLDVAIAVPQLLAARLVVLGIVLLVPGTLVLAAARLRLEPRFVRLAATVAASLLFLMVWGAASSALLPHLGLARPLGTVPLAVAVNVFIVSVAFLCPIGVDPVLDAIGPSSPATGIYRPWLASVPVALLAAAGAERLNNGHGSALVQVSILLATVMLVLGLVRVGGADGPDQDKPWARARCDEAQATLFTVSLALLYLYSFRSNHLFGYDIQQEYQRFVLTYAQGRWAPPVDGDPYASMLSITVLPASLSRLSGISGLYIFKGAFPLFLALVPGLTFEFARRWLPARSAYVGSAYLVVLADFSGQLPALARQEVGFLFFALLIVLLFQVELTGPRRQFALMSVLAGLVISHYSTSYVAIFFLAITWLIYMAYRVARNLGPEAVVLSKPAIRLPTVLAGIVMVIVWDVVITNSAANLSQFGATLADKGLQLLPNATKGSLISRYLSGNTASSVSPLKYYALALQASRSTQPWLRSFPGSVVSKFPAQPAPIATSLVQRLPHAGGAISVLQVATGELFLLLMGIGVVLLFVRGGQQLQSRVEAAMLCLSFLLFLVFVRVSGTVASSYNSDRAQLQAAVVMSLSLGLAVKWFVAPGRRVGLAAVAAALVVMLLTGTGESAELGGGAAPVLLANGGPGYDMFVISDDEVAAARWLLSTSGSSPLIYTDEFGMLRIWDGTGYVPLPQTWLTPATTPEGAWVYAAAYNVADDRAYGGVGSSFAVYRFPGAFLRAVDDLVYSGPTAQVYH